MAGNASGSNGSEVGLTSRVLDGLWDQVINAAAQLMVTVLKVARVEHAALQQVPESEAGVGRRRVNLS
jgi:hypothetical protein